MLIFESENLQVFEEENNWILISDQLAKRINHKRIGNGSRHAIIR
jgi:hypothetical protein